MSGSGVWRVVTTAWVGLGTVLAVPTGAEITRYPYLQPTMPSGTTVGVAWRTTNAARGTLYYGVKDPRQRQVAEGGEATEHYVVLKDLEPGTVYQYQVVCDGTETAVYRFNTSPPDGVFKALLLSDVHVHSPGEEGYGQWSGRWQKLYARMLEYDPDLVVIFGDITQRATQEEWEEFFRAHRELLATAIVVPEPGNHDKGQGEPYQPYRQQFHLPENGPAGHEGLNYSYDYGGCHFVMVLEAGEAIASWVERDLGSAKDARFLFGGRHWPIYVDTEWDFENQLDSWKQDLIAAFDRERMDVWFQGHRHVSQRSRPMVKNPHDPRRWGLIWTPEATRYNAKTRGTIYMQIRSCWYAKTGGMGLGQHFAHEPGGNQIGFATMDLAGPVCTVRSYRCNYDGSDWTKDDEFTIDKGDSTDLAAPRFVDGPSASRIEPYRAQITCKTDAPAKVLIDWGTEPGQYRWSTPPADVGQNYAEQHGIWLQAMQPGTRYYYRARALVQDKMTSSAEQSFATAEAGGGGQVVAQFNFQPMQYLVPGEWAGASDERYEAEHRYGWTQGSVDCWREPNPHADFALNSFCMVKNGGQACWRADMPDGVYELEMASGNAGEFYGPTRIELEGGQVVLTDAPPGDPSGYMIRRARVTVSDGSLDVRVGMGQKDSPKCTALNWLIVRSAGGRP